MNLIILLLFVLAHAASESYHRGQGSLALTIYNNGFAIVKDIRQFSFVKGKSHLYFTDVASTIQSETVTFKPQTTLQIQIAQQTFQDNLITKQALYKKYINRNVSVEFSKDRLSSSLVKGKLLNFDNQNLIIQNNDKQVVSLERSTVVSFDRLPEDFFIKPTLNWLVYSDQNVKTQCEIAYRATGFAWKSDYILTMNQEEDLADLSGWVSIENQSGKRYANATLKLIAGDVNQVVQGNNTFLDQIQQEQDSTALLGDYLPPQFTQKSFSDYHLYTLSQRVDLTAQSTKQLEFISRIYNVPIERYYEIDVNTGGRQQLNLKAQSLIQFENSKKTHIKLGIPLPKGIIRVFKNDDADNSLEFIGEDSIQHSPKGQKISLSIGNAFDLISNVNVVSKQTHQNSAFDAEMQMKISNHGTNTKKILIKIHSYYGSNMNLSLKNTQLQLIRDSSQLYKLWLSIKKDQDFTFKWSQNFSGY